MTQGFFLTGTDTDVGKTYAAVRLIRRWQAEGRRVAAMKPVASGSVRRPDGGLDNGDVTALMQATGQTDRALMNPYCFEPPVSPHLAAREAGVSIDLLRIVQQYRELATGCDTVLVEGAGGWLVPLTDEHDVAALAGALGLPVILVVGMRLGCVNHARLTAAAILASGCRLAGWVANAIDPDMARYADNLACLTERLPAPLLLEIPHGS
ncbi:dethiobiotin synthase [Laribacter hongkongensis]|uniref:ATP-dependent dethiobiotin synthetase BioD n=1 Tax=Laribacter hongkongensis TaxID=168471 RepID=A0A248LEE6_9NEIS|nr:dethiobiotin synthase [Laribacter hongkongensis]ASJ23002.1 ATP-dependent dethiobiotin synthetase BioD [Laribacter hongkongensis]MCG9041703.1 dethiobiotin synthase [Laribacter hongkongensis]MCG9067982.1 dethiobiotin synthase [Laribacter hongkongensis]MCG9088181.1 dethiobiotin synthase [Laribacter hongkongensis]MCG9098473.1 dethiobiotin synthase [Laribacter hongkongensis]